MAITDNQSVVLLSEGEYSNYHIIGIFIGSKEVDIKQLEKELESKEPDVKDYGSVFGKDKVSVADWKRLIKARDDWRENIPNWLKEKGFLEVGEHGEINI